jgi:hypothetical protein
MTSRTAALWAPAALAIAAVAACSDAFLYDDRRTDVLPADRAVTIQGELCTPGSNEVVRPIKILIAMDASQSMRVTDPNGTRATAVVQLLDSLPQDPEVYVAVMLFAGSTTVFLTRQNNDAGNFGSLPEFVPVTQMTPTDRQVLRSQILNFLSGGPNRDSTDFVKALADIYATISNDIAYARSDPTRSQYAARARYSVIFLSDGHPTLFQDDQLIQGDSNACTRIRQLSDLCEDVRLNTVHVFNPTQPLSTVCDLSGDAGTGCPMLIVNQDAERLETMAQLGGGEFRDFRNGEPINFLAFKFGQVRRAFEVKEIAVTNFSAPPGSAITDADSDGDRLLDADERTVGTDPLLKDTDGDGFSDGVEVYFAGRGAQFNPLSYVVNDAGGDPGCPPALRGVDKDCDGLTDCDESILGANADLMDSDDDGVPDPVEWQHHTSAAAQDLEEDPDNDFLTNRQEVKMHTDPKTLDTSQLSVNGYRYFLRATGPADSQGRQCFQLRVENILLANTLSDRPDGGVTGGIDGGLTLPDGGMLDGGRGPGFNHIQLSVAFTPMDDPTARTLVRRTHFHAARFPVGGIKSPPDGILPVTPDMLTDYCPRQTDGGVDGGP